MKILFQINTEIKFKSPDINNLIVLKEGTDVKKEESIWATYGNVIGIEEKNEYGFVYYKYYKKNKVIENRFELPEFITGYFEDNSKLPINKNPHLLVGRKAQSDTIYGTFDNIKFPVFEGSMTNSRRAVRIKTRIIGGETWYRITYTFDITFKKIIWSAIDNSKYWTINELPLVCFIRKSILLLFINKERILPSDTISVFLKKSKIPQELPTESEIPKKLPTESEIPQKLPTESEIPQELPTGSEIEECGRELLEYLITPISEKNSIEKNSIEKNWQFNSPDGWYNKINFNEKKIISDCKEAMESRNLTWWRHLYFIKEEEKRKRAENNDLLLKVDFSEKFKMYMDIFDDN